MPLKAVESVVHLTGETSTGEPACSPKSHQLEGDSVQRILMDWHGGAPFESVFERLFRVFYWPLHGFFTKRGLSPEHSEDLTQESFLCIYKSMGTFRGDAKFETWMFRIAANVYRQSMREQAAKKRSADVVNLLGVEDRSEMQGGDIEELSPQPQLSAGPVDPAMEEERRHMIHASITKLPDQMRRCLQLRLQQDLSYREIAQMMCLSIDTVKSHLFQGRRKLRVLLADYFAELNH